METYLGIEPSHYRFAARSAPSAVRHSSSRRRDSNPFVVPGEHVPNPSATPANRESGHRDSNSAGTVWRTGFSPREIPAAGMTPEASGRPYFHRPGDGFGIAGAHVRNRTEPASIPTRCTSIVLHGQAHPDATLRGATIVEMLGNAPSRLLCRRSQRPSASIPGRRGILARTRFGCGVAGRQRIERCPTDLESVRPPWPAPCGASYENRTRLNPESRS